MPDDMGKGIPRKEARNAAGEMAKTVREADANQKKVRDAAEAGQEAIRSGGEAVGKTPERASETVSRLARLASDAADASQQMARGSAEQFGQMFTRQIEVSQEVTRHAQQNLDVLMQASGVLAGGFQSIMQEWRGKYAEAEMVRTSPMVDGPVIFALNRTPLELFMPAPLAALCLWRFGFPGLLLPIVLFFLLPRMRERLGRNRLLHSGARAAG